MFINATYDQPDNVLPNGFKSTIEQVVRFFDETFTVPVTINIDIGFNEIFGQPISPPFVGQSFSSIGPSVTYAQLRSVLVHQNAPGSESLPLTDPIGGRMTIGSAEAKALGFLADNSSTIDGWVGFTNAAAGEVNFFGIVAHEISETMGRVTSIDQTGSYGPLDLFRYAAPGIRQLLPGQPAYFSFGGGATHSNDFNTVSGFDFGDWSSSVGSDAFSATIPGPLTQTDVLVVKALGWNASFTSQGDIAAGSLGDFIGDGRSDIIWRQPSGGVAEWQTNGAGELASTQLLGSTAAAWRVDGFGDFDGDGRSNILFHNVDGTIANWQTNASGQLLSIQLLGTTGTAWRVDGIGDFDGNGRSEILFRNTDGSVALWQTNTAGQLASAKLLGSAATSWHVAGIGDFDGNGRSDILFRDVDGSVAVWQIDAAGQLTSAQQIGTAASSWHIADVADFDGNGRSDILFVNDNGSMALWQTNAAGQFASVQSLGNPGPQWHNAGNGDLNGDGRSDILWRDDAGTVLEWLMNGAQVLSAQTFGSAPTSWEISVHHFDFV